MVGVGRVSSITLSWRLTCTIELKTSDGVFFSSCFGSRLRSDTPRYAFARSTLDSVTSTTASTSAGLVASGAGAAGGKAPSSPVRSRQNRCTLPTGSGPGSSCRAAGFLAPRPPAATLSGRYFASNKLDFRRKQLNASQYVTGMNLPVAGLGLTATARHRQAENPGHNSTC